MIGDDVLSDLDALVGLGGGHESTISGAVRPAPTSSAPRGWEPGYKIEPGGGMTVTTMATTANVQHDEGAWVGLVEDLGLAVPDGWVVRLVEAKYDAGAWGRDQMFVEWPDADEREAKGQSRYTKTPALRDPVWRYRFAVVPDTMALITLDADVLMRDALRARRKPKTPLKHVERGLVVVYADSQIGKVGSGGGTRELAARILDRFDRLDDHIRDLRKIGRAPDSAFWMDAGDGIENFDNVTSQAFTNDLSLTEMVRAYRRVTFEGLDRLSRQFDRVTAAACSSNHSQVRRGKDPVGPPTNDWGLEVLSQVQDAFAANEDAYGHVSFAYPEKWRSTVTIDVAGTLVGLAHGHQTSQSNRVPEWWKGQAFGNEPIGAARILISGHWHHLRAQQLADGRLWVQAPTLDNQSDWWSEISGDKSEPGLLVMSVTKDGWDDLRIL